VNLLEELELLFEGLTSVLGVDVEQRLVVEVLNTTTTTTYTSSSLH